MEKCVIYMQSDLVRISMLLVTTVCSCSKYNVRPRNVLKKKCWLRSFHRRLAREGFFLMKRKLLFPPMKFYNIHNQHSS